MARRARRALATRCATAFLELNQTLQRKLVDYLRTVKKNEENKEAEKSVTDQEQRYFKCLAQVNELRDELKRLQQQYDRTAMEMKKRPVMARAEAPGPLGR